MGRNPDRTLKPERVKSMRKMVIKMVMTVAVLAVAAGLGGAAAQDRSEGGDQPKVKEPKLKVRLDDKLKFMAGCWEGQIDEETVVEEIWTNPSQNLMTSTTRYLRKNRATSFEFSKIVSTDSTVTFAASSEGKPFDEYTMIQLVDDYVVFENLKKTFPQRISYRRTSDGSLVPRNEGEGQPGIEVRFKKVRCPGG
jgi:hypothetical protein